MFSKIMIALIIVVAIFALVALVDPRLANDIINLITGAPGPGGKK